MALTLDFFCTRAFGKWFRTKLGCLLFLTRWRRKKISHICTFSHCKMRAFLLFLETYEQKDLQMKESAIRCYYGAADTVHLEENVENLYPSCFSKRPQNPLSLKRGKLRKEIALNICSVYFSDMPTHIFLKIYLDIFLHVCGNTCVISVQFSLFIWDIWYNLRSAFFSSLLVW